MGAKKEGQTCTYRFLTLLCIIFCKMGNRQGHSKVLKLEGTKHGIKEKGASMHIPGPT